MAGAPTWSRFNIIRICIYWPRRIWFSCAWRALWASRRLVKWKMMLLMIFLFCFVFVFQKLSLARQLSSGARNGRTHVWPPTAIQYSETMFVYCQQVRARRRQPRYGRAPKSPSESGPSARPRNSCPLFAASGPARRHQTTHAPGPHLGRPLMVRLALAGGAKWADNEPNDRVGGPHRHGRASVARLREWTGRKCGPGPQWGWLRVLLLTCRVGRGAPPPSPAAAAPPAPPI